MWEIAINAITLLLRGKLFADPGKVYRQMAVGATATVVVLIGAVKLGAPLWIAALVAGLSGGLLQPFLLKDLRYR